MTLLAFMSDSPFLGFLLICSAYYLLRHAMRVLTIAARGWPPEHCDADGDFRKRDEE